jgi:hypothetical protein
MAAGVSAALRPYRFVGTQSEPRAHFNDEITWGAAVAGESSADLLASRVRLGLAADSNALACGRAQKTAPLFDLCSEQWQRPRPSYAAQGRRRRRIDRPGAGDPATLFDNCPICGSQATEEHVPPQKMGGRVMTRTCKAPRRRARRRFETRAQGGHQLVALRQHLDRNIERSSGFLKKQVRTESTAGHRRRRPRPSPT